MKRVIAAIGPAIIVAAVVLGPGSIVTSSRVGAQQGLIGVPIIVAATSLMMVMVTLSARLGAVCEHSLCTEISNRLGRPFSVGIGLVLFALVAIFQSSNNAAVIGGIEPLFGGAELSLPVRVAVLGALNLAIIICLYQLRNLYGSVERLMKFLIAVMVAAFVTNLAVIMSQERGYEPVESSAPTDWLAILGLIGTTFSIGGAFYQAYLVKEKGWGIADVRRGTVDSVLGITVLGAITCVVLLTSWRVFYGDPNRPPFGSVNELAMLLEPAFGSSGRIVFACGILAGALSSFLGNALIGGTVLSDSIGKGASLQNSWPLHLTTAAMVTGFTAAAVSMIWEGSTVHLITFAQALTVVGLPVMAASLVYLGTRPDLQKGGHVPKLLVGLAVVGFGVSCVLATLTVSKVVSKINPPEEATVQLNVPRQDDGAESITDDTTQDED